MTRSALRSKDALRMESTVASDDLRERLRLAPLPLIAARIRRARRSLGLSHDELGARMGGVTRQHLIKLEQAKHRPGPEMLQRLAKATDRAVEWFVDPEVDPSPFPEEQPGDGRRAA